MSPNDEYDVHGRLVRLETVLSEVENKVKAHGADIDAMKPRPSKSGQLNIQSPIVIWAILTATALTSGPNFLDLLAKALLK